MQQPAKKFYTPDEYLTLEEVAEEKSEYYQGEIFTMAGGSLNHNRIAVDLCAKLNQSIVKQKCEAFSENIRLCVASLEFFTYPDIMVICGQPEYYENYNNTVTNPLIIVEVLSESTKNYDRGEKFKFYRSVPTLREYVLIDQYGFHVEQYVLSEKGQWFLTEYKNGNDTLRFSSIDFDITLKDIYRRVQHELQ